MSEGFAETAVCGGICLTGADIGVGSGGVDDVAYPHPDCPRHGDLWVPFDNEWSRHYVAAHPDRFPPAPPTQDGA